MYDGKHDNVVMVVFWQCYFTAKQTDGTPKMMWKGPWKVIKVTISLTIWCVHLKIINCAKWLFPSMIYNFLFLRVYVRGVSPVVVAKSTWICAPTYDEPALIVALQIDYNCQSCWLLSRINSHFCLQLHFVQFRISLHKQEMVCTASRRQFFCCCIYNNMLCDLCFTSAAFLSDLWPESKCLPFLRL